MKFKSTLTALTLGAVMATGVGMAVFAQTAPAPMGGPMGMVAFAQIDTNGDKVLSPDEVHAYVASQIKGLDANNDGFLTADEIAAKMTQLAHDRILARATEMVARIDKNADGKGNCKTTVDGAVPLMVKLVLISSRGIPSKSTSTSARVSTATPTRPTSSPYSASSES